MATMKDLTENDIKKMRAQFDRFFTDKPYEQILADNGLNAPAKLEEGKKVRVHAQEEDTDDSKEDKKEQKKEMSTKAKREFGKNAAKNDGAKAKKGKNKMGAMPEQQPAAGGAAPQTGAPAPKPPAAGAMKKNMKESKKGAKVVYGLREGEQVKRYVIIKEDVKSAVAAAKRIMKNRDLSETSYIDVLDHKTGFNRTIYESLESYKNRKRLFETHVICGECGCKDLELSPKRTKIRCTRCGTEDLVENVEGVKK